MHRGLFPVVFRRSKTKAFFNEGMGMFIDFVPAFFIKVRFFFLCKVKEERNVEWAKRLNKA